MRSHEMRTVDGTEGFTAEAQRPQREPQSGLTLCDEFPS